MRRKAAIWFFSTIGGLTVLSAVGAGIGVGLSQTKTTATSLKGYNASCTNNSNCITVSQYGLICINNTCSCSSISSYNGSSCGQFKNLFFQN